MIDSKTLFKVAQVQGHKVNVKYRIMYKNCFDYTSRRNNWILIKLIHRIDVNRTLNVTHCKSQNVKIKYLICGEHVILPQVVMAQVVMPPSHYAPNRSWKTLKVSLSFLNLTSHYAPGRYAPGHYAPGRCAPGHYAPIWITLKLSLVKYALKG